MARREPDLITLAAAREHAALCARAEKLERIQVGNPAARRELKAAKHRMLELERRA